MKRLMVLALFMWGCSEAGLVTSPSVEDAPLPAGEFSSGIAPQASREWSPPIFQVDGPFMKVTVENPKRGPRYVGLACYQGQVHDIDNQVLGPANHQQVKRVGAGEKITLRAALHCGHNQCDAFFDLREAPQVPQFGSKLLGAKLHFHECDPPEDPPEDPPDECTEKTPIPEGHRECPTEPTLNCVEIPCCVWSWELCGWICGEIPPPPPRCDVSNIEGGCYYPNKVWGNPKRECGRFGLVPIGKREYGGEKKKRKAHMSAPVAIVKAGKTYRVYTYVTKGDKLKSCGKAISHITYCDCPPPIVD